MKTANMHKGKRARSKNKKDVNIVWAGKKTTITLALDDMVLKAIRKDAELDRSSLNSKVNKILERYTDFYKYAELLGSVIIPQQQFRDMLEIMDEGELTSIMKAKGNANVLSVLTNLGIRPDLNSLNKYCFSRFIQWSGAYDSFNSYIDTEGYPCLVFEHKFGIKWSRIIADTICDTINLILQYPTEKKVMPSTVLIRVMERGLKLDDY